MKITNPLFVADDIYLEVIDLHHAASIYNIANANRLQLREWMPWVDKMQDVQFIINFINNAKQQFTSGRDYSFVIVYYKKIVGRIGVYNIDMQNKTAAIGYWLAGLYQGKGIITRSCETLIGFCFNELGLNRIEIRCGTENYKSQAIPMRLSFNQEGIIRQGELLQDKFIDLYLYALLKKDWIQK